jgi:hypothetical protein
MAVSPRVTWGFVAAGFMNIVGMLLFSKGLTNDYLIELSPNVFNRFGLLCVTLWGLAYLGTARGFRAAPALVLVFAVEKAVYTLTWFVWLADHGSSFGTIWERDPLTAIFYVIYGPNDLLFGIFFAWFGFKAWMQKV